MRVCTRRFPEIMGQFWRQGSFGDRISILLAVLLEIDGKSGYTFEMTTESKDGEGLHGASDRA